MADAKKIPNTGRRNTSGAASPRSGNSRSNSRASSPDPPLTRLISGRHLDDHPTYHGHGFHREASEEAVEDETSDEDHELTEKDTNETGEIEPESSGDNVAEVRDGIEDQRDLEAGPNLEKSRTTKSGRSGRSARDPNLVSWTGPEDPDNPKNWTFKRLASLRQDHLGDTRKVTCLLGLVLSGLNFNHFTTVVSEC